MTRKDFFFKVATLRYYQKEYFATRSREALAQAKALEKEIDDEIARVQSLLSIESQMPRYQQPNLFQQ